MRRNEEGIWTRYLTIYLLLGLRNNKMIFIVTHKNEALLQHNSKMVGILLMRLIKKHNSQLNKRICAGGFTLTKVL